MTYRKKLIEVALPLEEINKQSAREKSIRHGHPSTLHLWWARRPLAACRAVLFSSMVDDPGEYLPEGEARAERERIFRLIEQLVNWDNVNNEKVLGQARFEIAKSVARDLDVDVPIGDAAVRQFLAEKAPPVLDPFCGGGSIPLEAQRLGLQAFASDLNPVAVLITKALIEIPPKFANQPPVHPPEDGDEQTSFMEREWKGAQGLAEDVRYYGKRMQDDAEKHIGHLFPKIRITQKLLSERTDLMEKGLKTGDELTVIAWLFARTVKCPNPACGLEMPLVRTFWLAKGKKENVWISPYFNKESSNIKFKVVVGDGAPQNGTKRRGRSKCLYCNKDNITDKELRRQAIEHGIGQKLLAIVVEGKAGRIYIDPDYGSQTNLSNKIDVSFLDQALPSNPRWFSPPGYGLTSYKDLHTSRQLITLKVFSELASEARQTIRSDASLVPFRGDLNPDSDTKTFAEEYADAVGTYLALAVSRSSSMWSSFCWWQPSGEFVAQVFARQAIAMVWDYAEVNPFSSSTGNWLGAVNWISRVIDKLTEGPLAHVTSDDAMMLQLGFTSSHMVCTDPPYYDNVGYSDLSDFYYLRLRSILNPIYPDLFSTLLTPKSNELIAVSDRFNGDYDQARDYFEGGLLKSFGQLVLKAAAGIPITVFYAFKQTEEESEGLFVSTGWETMLEGLLSSGLSITATWPIRTERSGRPVAFGTNALASSVVLTCRPRPADAPVATRRDFLAFLKEELPIALKEMQQGAIAPVDLAQSTVGPGMAVYSRYSKVLEADGSSMTVRMALALINQVLDEYLSEQESDLDPDSRWAVTWYEQFGHEEGPFGDAETLSKAKNSSVDGLVRAGILESRGGKVRLLKRVELDPNWDPSQDKRLTTWEAAQYLILTMEKSSEAEAATLLRRLGGVGQAARDLAYRLYSICERKGWAQEALAYNMLATAWQRLMELGQHEPGLAQDQLL